MFVGLKAAIKFADLLKELTRLNSRLYTWLRFIRAKIDRHRAIGKYINQEEPTEATFEYIPIWSHPQYAFSLATN